jgi:TonB family protein
VGFLPEELHERLAGVATAEVSRACGNLDLPWGYRGKAGRRLALRDYGRRDATPEQARRLAAWLAAAPLDTVYLATSRVIPCEAGQAPPVYLVRFSGKGRPTWALLRFDIAAVVLFDSELPLGLVLMEDRADTLWNALAEMFDDDPAFRRPRPAPEPLRSRGAVHDTTSAGMRPDYTWVESLPEAIERVAPVYPEEARRQLVDGIVWVQALVGQDGLVRDAIVRSGPPLLRDASLEAVWQWQFKPARSEGRSLAVWVLIPVKFTQK